MNSPLPWRLVAERNGLVHVVDADGEPVIEIESTDTAGELEVGNLELIVASVNANVAWATVDAPAEAALPPHTVSEDERRSA